MANTLMTKRTQQPTQGLPVGTLDPSNPRPPPRPTKRSQRSALRCAASMLLSFAFAESYAPCRATPRTDTPYAPRRNEPTAKGPAPSRPTLGLAALHRGKILDNQVNIHLHDFIRLK